VSDQKAEKSLVRKAIKRDKTAFTNLYWDNVDRVYKHVFYRVCNQHSAEDITQETFIKAWKAIDKYQERGNTFVAWLIAIADNVTIDYLKSHNRNVPLDDDIIEQPVSRSEMDIEKRDNRIDIRDAISKLPEEKQKVVIMRYIEGFSFSEIAKSLNKSNGAVRVVLHRALNDLRNILGV